MLQIRKAYPTDAFTLIQVNDVAWKQEYYDFLPNGIMNEMENTVDERVLHLRDQIEENNRVLVAVDEGKVVGFAFYAKAPSNIYSNSAEIRAIYVLPEYQRQGVGSQLFDAVLLELNKLRYRSFIVYCPSDSSSCGFFEKLGGKKREIISKNLLGYQVQFDVIYFSLEAKEGMQAKSDDWNRLFTRAQEQLFLLDSRHREVAVILTDQGNMYLGLGIMDKVCPLEVALSNMYLAGEKVVEKILILDRESHPVLPCGNCRDLFNYMGQQKAVVLFDIGSLKTMTMEELNPYYKKEKA